MAPRHPAPAALEAGVFTSVPQTGCPRISVVVPAYNEERYLGSCLEALLHEPTSDFEVVVVDDGSSDRTGAIAAMWAERDARVRLVSNDTNLGLPRTLNRGFDEARGQILTWISGDNWVGPNFVAGLSAELDAHPELDIVYGDTVICDEAGTPIQALQREGVERLAQINVIRSCFMFRRRTLEQVGPYKPRWAMIEDYEFWLRCRRAGLQFRFATGAVVYHRLHPESLTTQFRRQVARRGVEARAWHLRHSMPLDPHDIVRLVKDIMRHLPIRRALRHAIHWTGRASLRQRPRLCVQICLELAVRSLKRDRD
jgi:glycosyltransferase involved in cell wall biosynthesis